MRIDTCIICGNQKFNHAFEIYDLWHNNKDLVATYDYCEHCQLIFQNPRYTSNDFHLLYPDNYSVYVPKRLNKLACMGFEKRAKIILEQKKSGYLLDIGCASGDFIRFMRDVHQWNVVGLEPNQRVAEFARTNYHLDIINAPIEAIDYPAESLDVITLWDVLEHLEDPAQTLQRLYQLLKPDGILILRLPNSSSRDAKLFGKYWAGLDSPRHFFVFNQNNLSSLLQANGFEISKIRTDIGTYLNFVKSVQFWLTDQSINPGVRRTIIKILASMPLRILLFPIFRLRDAKLHGNSMVLSAHKINLPQVNHNEK